MSPDGHCRPFDARAQGTVFANGMGVVVLRRLEDALADGDPIWATILGSAIGNDGSNKVGYAAVSVEGQAQVIAEAVALSGVDPASVSYVEAHGTGTAMGDTIELAALSQVYRQADAAGRDCMLGSVKANIGHISIAAGVVGLIKTALMLHHRRVPPTLHFESWNPECEPANSRFTVGTRLSPWEDDGQPLRAAVSSFGMGGTNAHVLLEEALAAAPRGLSARSRS